MRIFYHLPNIPLYLCSSDGEFSFIEIFSGVLSGFVNESRGVPRTENASYCLEELTLLDLEGRDREPSSPNHRMKFYQTIPQSISSCNCMSLKATLVIEDEKLGYWLST